MSARQANAPAAGANQPAQRGWQETVKSLATTVGTMIAFQMVMRYGMQYMGIGPQAKAPAPADPGESIQPVATTPAQPGVINADPIWPLGTPISMFLYLSTAPSVAELDVHSPLLIWDGLKFGDWDQTREADLILDVPETVRAENGSWWMDILLVKGGDKVIAGKTSNEIATYRKELTRWMPKRRVRKEKKLIGNDESEGEEYHDDETHVSSGPAPIVAHWSRNLTLTIIGGGGTINIAGLQPQVAPHYRLAPTEEGAPKLYFPPVFPNDFWILRENLVEINSTVHQLPLTVTYSTIAPWKFQLYAAMTASFEQAAQQQGTGAEMDEIKHMLTETHPLLLATTIIVTILHTVFEFLAFSSDVSHWRKKDKDLVGVSLRTILTNCFVQLVILLYLHDSSEETSFMVLFGQGIGLLIEAWKITKVVNIRIREAPGTLIGYKITFEDKHELSEEEKKTQEYDQLAFRLVSYGAIPLLTGYTIYSLLYKTHRSWYSFIVTTLAQAIYMFGFVQLVPQLIINYKLKSVAHMPMKAMVYKTLGTVIDDLFAFCIRMPWLHRLACFRDDVVFLILLYQRWIYRIDYSRVNEFGQVTEGKAEPVGDKSKAENEKIESKKNK